MNKWRVDWIKKKAAIADSLNSGALDAGYADGVIILFAVISALSAEVWHSAGIDRRRFPELLIRFGDIVPHPATISIPLLIGYLRNNSRDKEADNLQENFMNYNKARVLVGHEVDQTEQKVISICNTLTPKEIRKYSYANILYQ